MKRKFIIITSLAVTAFAFAKCEVTSIPRVKVVQWNIGHFAHGKSSHTAIEPSESSKRSAEYRKMIAELKADFLGISEYDPKFDKAGTKTVNELFQSFSTKIIGPKKGYQSNALFTHFPCQRYEIIDFKERKQKTYFINAVFKFGTNEVHFVQSHLDWALLPERFKRPPEDRRFAQRQLKQLAEHFKDMPYVIISADFNVSRMWHFKSLINAGYTIANDGKYDLLDNIAVKGFKVLDVFEADAERRLSDHRIVGCTLEMKQQ